ncbi:PAS domain S-box [Rivularia sp. PCC 7116]|uniref:sensor histidine kinase n=1 Tax=Rivularia sp. PCC 7116 TaxID=373994 RepID=UPI00029F00FA|nr:PAS domain S-box protein [Rivularia sp. PCC 7116]AFY57907.1 PAS domain S-box [Rivularia sp. PCC 7116]
MIARRRYEVEEPLLNSAELFRLAFNDAAIGMALVAPDGQWLKVNRALCEIVGYSEIDLLKKTFQEITHPEDLEVDLSYLHQVLAGEIRTYQMEKRYFHSSGHIVWILLNVSLVRDREAQPLYFIAQIQDITPRKQAEARLKSLLAELERSNSDLEEFASVVSHDLISPLHRIQILSEYLQEDYNQVLGEQGNDYVQRIVGIRNRMQTLVEGLLQFSLVTIQGQPFTEVDLGKVVRGVISDLQADYLADVVLEVGDLPTLLADSAQMYQLFQNLVSNSLKYRQPEIGLFIKIYQTRRSQNHELNGQYEIVVADNGIGFDEVYLEQIFEPCQRLHNSSEYEGTGLGLAICRRIIERHGGKISAQSKPNEGAKFIITLPFV